MIEQGASERRLSVADVVGLRCLAYPATHIGVADARLVCNVGGHWIGDAFGVGHVLLVRSSSSTAAQ